ncbi:MAG: membrane protein insertase YidC [Candidatus Neomarinimicrobiota bacterium]|nr:membrane protein insertase YidC [Candidatus Neomarinimicrobiota bacterium]
MDRQTLLAFLLIGFIIVLYPWYMSIVSPPELNMVPPSTQPKELVNENITPEKIKSVATKRLDTIPVKSIGVSTNLYDLTISNKNGGAFTNFNLYKYQDHNDNLVNLIDNDNSNNMVIGFVSIDGDKIFLDKNWSIVDNINSLSVERGQKSLTFKTNFSNQTITKKYTFYADTYNIDIDVEFENPSRFISRNQYTLNWNGGMPATEKDLSNDYLFFEGYASLGGERMGSKPKKGKSTVENQNGSTLWSAIKTKYFISAIIPSEPGIGAQVQSELNNEKPIYNTEITQSSNSNNRFTVYLGPLDYDRLSDFNVGLEENVDLGWALFRPIGQVISWLLTKMYAIIPNYGLVVVVFAFLIKLLLNPLTVKTFESTRKMQALAPEIQKLKEKYKNDPQKMSRAQMELYKNSGANPLGGCLPMLIQMPILVSVFSIFRSKIEFRGAPFFGWISDLSVPDTLISIGSFPINILPVLMGSTMFIQQKMMSAPNADTQQKTMMYVMNVFFLFLFYRFPSGLNLYYFVFNLLTILQQKYLIPKPALSSSAIPIKK